MKKLFLFSMIVMMSCLSFSQDDNKQQSNEVTTLYFIRHAEKDRSNPSEKDPHLMRKGLERAEKWSRIFVNIPFDAVYSSKYNRTMETAQPTAYKNKVEITIYDPHGIDSKAFVAENKGKNVLIVGHSNTIHSFVNAILGNEKHQEIDDTENGNLYIVTIIDGKASDHLLTIN